MARLNMLEVTKMSGYFPYISSEYEGEILVVPYFRKVSFLGSALGTRMALVLVFTVNSRTTGFYPYSNSAANESIDCSNNGLAKM